MVLITSMSVLAVETECGLWLKLKRGAMSRKWSTDAEKIDWLVDHSHLWEDDFEHHFDAMRIRMFKVMRRASLYSGETSYDAVSRIKLSSFLNKAKKRLDDEGSIF